WSLAETAMVWTSVTGSLRVCVGRGRRPDASYLLAVSRTYVLTQCKNYGGVPGHKIGRCASAARYASEGGRMRTRSLAGALSAVLLMVGVAQAQVSPTTPASVVGVVDGDTVDVQFDDGRVERLRLIGIDTPEVVDPRTPVQCFGREASQHAHD